MLVPCMLSCVLCVHQQSLLIYLCMIGKYNCSDAAADADCTYDLSLLSVERFGCRLHTLSPQQALSVRQVVSPTHWPTFRRVSTASRDKLQRLEQWVFGALTIRYYSWVFHYDWGWKQLRQGETFLTSRKMNITIMKLWVIVYKLELFSSLQTF